MATPRRQLIRSATNRLALDRRSQKLRLRLEADRKALVRWQTKLRRAFNTVAKLQKSIGRLERQLAHREE